MKIERILAPVDFSELSEAAARHAVALATQFNSALTFLHVSFPQTFKYYGAPEGGAYVATVSPSPEEELANAQRQMDALVTKVSANRAAKQAILQGEPAAEIVGYAKENRSDLIVMPTRGYGAFRRFILGSVTAKVLHDADCPVFTCPHGADLALNEPHPYRRVACALDLGPHSENVLRWAAGFAAASGAELAVIHAAPWLRTGGFDLGMEIRSAVLNAVHEEVQGLLQKVGCRAEVHAETAEVSEYVPRAASSTGAELLVIGRTGKEGLFGRLRANTYALLRESPCPVVSL